VSRDKSTKPFPISNLQYLQDEGKLWLSPKYQREEVWTRSQKQLLVDSLLNGIDIPKIYFRQINHGGYEYEVVDGQQRLRAVFEFLADEYPLGPDAEEMSGEKVANQQFSKLATDLQMKLRMESLDVVVLKEYSDDDVEEIFLRLQNGTPLNAAEKRRAIAGTMRAVVQEMSKHRIFNLSGFSDKRYAYEDAVAKGLHLLLNGGITEIRPASIRRTYESNKSIDSNHKEVLRLRKSYNFITKAFEGKQNPRFKKYSIITVPFLTIEMLDTYDLASHGDDFAEAYLDFETQRIANSELPEEKQDAKLAAYTNAARSDSIQDMRYRHESLRDYLVEQIPTLVPKDPTRMFTQEQRMAIFRLNNGECQVKGPNCEGTCEDSAFHADHKIAHSKGGPTSVENGQVSCIPCNLWKGANP
jgi:hypothetical protein